jgi:hypothetical protein
MALCGVRLHDGLPRKRKDGSQNVRDNNAAWVAGPSRICFLTFPLWSAVNPCAPMPSVVELSRTPTSNLLFIRLVAYCVSSAKCWGVELSKIKLISDEFSFVVLMFAQPEQGLRCNELTSTSWRL